MPMTVRKLKCSGCGRELEYSYDSACDVRLIVVHCSVCPKKTRVAVPVLFSHWGDPNFLPLTTVVEVVGKLPNCDGLYQLDKNLSPHWFSPKQTVVDYSAPPKPPPTKWQVPKKSKNFDGLRKELDDLHVQLDEARAVLIDRGKSIRSLTIECEHLRAQLTIALNETSHVRDRIAVLEKRPPSLDAKPHRAFPERPNYAEWVSEDEELLEEGYNGFPKSKERVVF